jgi:extracellular elastinolytic metalloproteinase
MNRNVFKVLALGSAVLMAACAQAELEPDPLEPAIYRSPGGVRLTPPSKAAPEAIVRDFLRARGLPAPTAETLVVQSTRLAASTGIRHVRLEQVAAGLRVHGGYIKAAFTGAGELVHLIDAAARVKDPAPRAASIDPRAALRAALAAHHPRAVAAPVELGRQGNVTTFARGDLFYSEPTVERVAVATDGALAEGFLVETWTLDGNLLHHTLIGGGGEVLHAELRTNSEAYHVFPVSPDRTPQTMMSGPGGWLGAGEQRAHDIWGNNVHAYADADANGLPDGTGPVVTNGIFDAVFDPIASPGTESNRAVAVQNLFYLNNVIHDTLHAAGFDEEAGNFQEDNFGRGGLGGDSVNAEAQDGGGMNNANFATPVDGRKPRMQMYLWSVLGDRQVVVEAPASVAATYRAQGGAFGPAPAAPGIRGEVVPVDDGSTAEGTGTTFDGCEAMTGLEGKIALLERGLCPFVVKVKNAQDAGAIAVIVANNQGGDAIMSMGGTDATITIPAALISQDDGARLRAAGTLTATLRLADPPPVPRDGDLDSDIVWHEYGHGLTWRMIGGMSGPMSGAIGEGMSDVLAILANEDDAVGEYSASDRLGIRSVRYGDFARSYGDFKGQGVHYEGELYGAIGWRLFTSFRAAGIPKSVLLGYLVDGMNYTRQGPAFEDMRDGVLQAAAGTGHECLIWRAYAAFGVGVDARGVVRGPRIWVNDSKDVPPACR